MITVEKICRYPVKGLSAEALEQVDLVPGDGLPLDRRFALAQASAPFDPEHPEPLAKTHFLMLMRNERLAALQTEYDDATGMLTVRRHGRIVARGDLGQMTGRRLLEQFFKDYMGEEARGMPRLVSAPGHQFSDVGVKVVSMINLATVRDLERVAGRPVDPLRFRGNIYIDGLDAWREFDWIDKRIKVGQAVLEVIERIERCAATNVDPLSGERDMQIPRTLQQNFGHINLGVYAAVRTAGRVALSDTIETSFSL